MMGREVKFHFPAKRIISLVPSQTEFLIDIGASLVGRTKFCIHPADKIQDIPNIGGTKNFRFEKIKELQPDLIIGNKEENYQEGIESLAKDFPVWMSDIYTLKDSFNMMASIGSLCDLKVVAKSIIEECRVALEKVKNTKKGSVLYLIWQNPWMAAGKNTFIDHMLHFLGYGNVIKTDRYPKLSESEIAELNPDYIFLSSEPFPFKEKHLNLVRSLWPQADCQLVDGELYSWYGSRLKHFGNL